MLRFTLNGTQIEIEDGENRTLLEYLRNVKCMKGTKEACSTGHGGAFRGYGINQAATVSYTHLTLPTNSRV